MGPIVKSVCGWGVREKREGGPPPLPGRKYPAIRTLPGMIVCKIVITKGLRINISK
jgi:hypothetical protein